MFLTRALDYYMKENELNPVELMQEFYAELKEQPDVCTNGGNDKEFFSFKFAGKKIWAVRNEVDSHTLMFPEDY